MKCTLKITLMLFLMCLLPASLSSEIISSAQNYVPGEVLVTPGGVYTANTITAMGMELMAKHKGATRFIRLKLKPGQSVESAVQALSTENWVAHVQPNYIYHATAVPNDPRFAEYWGLQNTGQSANGATGIAGADMSAVAAWDETSDCSSIVVAVTDTGVDYNHPDLSANMWSNAAEALDGADTDGNGFVDDVRGWDFVQGDNDPMDFNKHGSHVAGTIGAAGNNGIGGTGVCWNVRIMPLRVLGSTGSGSTAEAVAAIDYAVANGAKVINMSLGGTGGFDGDLQSLAIGSANAAGVLVIAAAGNDGVDNDVTPNYPSSYNQPNIIAVAATDQNDALASFSNWGATSVDVGAPGTNILSTFPPARTPVLGCSWNYDTGTAIGWTLQTWDNINNIQVANTVAVTNEDFLSPAFSLTDTPGSAYAINSSYRGESPACDLTGQQGAVLNYELNLETEFGFDFLFLEGSSDGVIWNNPFGTGVGFSGSTLGSWLNSSLLGADGNLDFLDGIATAQVRFRLEADFINNLDGLHVDDVNITVPGTVHTGTEYHFLNGTSMATPNVAGVAALVWAADPGLGHLQVRNRIFNNGDAIAALAGNTTTGRRANAQFSMPLHAATGLSATAVSATQVDLTWMDNSVSEVNYLVQRDSGGGFATIATLAADGTSYGDTAAPVGANLSYQIVTQARDGRTLVSAAVNTTTPAPPSGGGAGGGGGCLIPSGIQSGCMLAVLGLMIGGIALARRRIN